MGKKKEVATLTAQIEKEMERLGQLNVLLATGENQIEDAKEAVAADTKFLEELKTGCDTKTAEWEQIKKTRAEELVALAETIKVLNDDDALELFKKTLPSAASSLVQVEQGTASRRMRALALLQQAAKRGHPDRAHLDFIQWHFMVRRLASET